MTSLILSFLLVLGFCSLVCGQYFTTTFHGGSPDSFVITIGIGTPPIDQSVLVDTGSDLCYVNCTECIGECNPTTQMEFDPSLSETYQRLPCNGTVCSEHFSCGDDYPDNTVCPYTNKYDDGSAVIGVLSNETVTISPSNKIPNFIFGCNEKITGSTYQIVESGLFGFGRGPLSFISQLPPSYPKIFSYCFPGTSNLGYLKLGHPTPVVNNTTISYTPMVKLERPPYYWVDVLGVAISGVSLDINQTLFTDAGVIVDSGTSLTYLPRTAYNVIEAAFKNEMEGYTLTPSEDDSLCYNITGVDYFYVPPMVFMLGGGVNLTLVDDQIYYLYGEDQACFSISPVDDDNGGILGYQQMKKFEIVYDLENLQIGFRSGTCNSISQ